MINTYLHTHIYKHRCIHIHYNICIYISIYDTTNQPGMNCTNNSYGQNLEKFPVLPRKHGNSLSKASLKPCRDVATR